MDGKTPPTTSVVIDLEKPLDYELTPGSPGKVILTLHTQGAAPSVAKNNPALPVKATNPATVKASSPAPAVKAAGAAGQPTATVKSAVAVPKVAVVKMPAQNATGQPSKQDPKQEAKAAAHKVAAPATGATTKIAATSIAPSTAKASPAVSAPAPAPAKSAVATKQPKPEEKKWAMSGKRDPFFSPVVQQNGSGCSTGKKCLEIGAINLRGVVKYDSGFIAGVANSLNKSYFLRENDPVFNGYVVKITGDSVVFQETLQDKLGKSFTREVVKRILPPAR